MIKAGSPSGLIWLVDPIDGTRDFVRGRSGWAVSVALISGGAAHRYAVRAARGEPGWPWRGRGAFERPAAYRIHATRVFRGARAGGSLPKTDTDLVTVEKPNSIALRIAMVADDRADLVATVRWGFEWDIAAAGHDRT